MKAGKYGKQRDRSKKYPSLNKEQQQLVQSNMWVADTIGSRYIRKGGTGILDKDDLTSIGYMALCAVAPRYKPEIGKFSTFSWIFVEGWIQHAIRDHSRTVRLPRSVINNRGRVKRLIKEEGLKYPEVAAKMGITVQLVSECEKSWRVENTEINDSVKNGLTSDRSSYSDFSEECKKIVESLTDEDMNVIEKHLANEDEILDIEAAAKYEILKDRIRGCGIIL